MAIKQTKEQFIQKTILKHGNRYNYSLVEYINNKTNVNIICQIHGIFSQRADKHSFGHGCAKCHKLALANEKRLTIDEFIAKSRIIHGKKYDYSLVNYKNNLTKVKIVCSKHGVFEQRPSSHLSGLNCLKCRYRSNEEYINEVKKIHKGKYDYSLTDFKSMNEKIIIICKKHGNFSQVAMNHMYGIGCKKCGTDKSMESIRGNTEDFIKKSKEIHKDKYDYSLVEYNHCQEKVKIVCSIHGIFEQQPNAHLNNHGCPKCCESKGESKIREFLIKNSIKFINQKRFDDCKDKNTLPFDYYLPELNICIEFDGAQHFIPVDYWGGEDRLLDTQKKDNIKTQYCKNNNIILLRIRYDEDIIEKLGENIIFGNIYN